MRWIARRKACVCWKCRISGELLPEFFLVQNRNAELARLGKLAACVLACHDERGLLTDAAGDLAAGLLDHLFRFLAAERGQRPGEHEGHAVQRTALGPSRFVGELKARVT